MNAPAEQEIRWPALGTRKLPVGKQVFELFWVPGSGTIVLKMPDGRSIASWRSEPFGPVDLDRDFPEPWFRHGEAFDEFSRTADIELAHAELLRIDRGRRGPRWPRLNSFAPDRAGFIAYLEEWEKFRKAETAWAGDPRIIVYAAFQDHQAAVNKARMAGWISEEGSF